MIGRFRARLHPGRGKWRTFVPSVQGWTLEYASASLSVLSLMGLVVLLAVQDDRPIFDWHGLTVNALVALLSTVSRASLMFALAEAISQTKWIFFHRSQRKLYDFDMMDVASRDAAGRLVMLWRMPFR